MVLFLGSVFNMLTIGYREIKTSRMLASISNERSPSIMGPCTSIPPWGILKALARNSMSSMLTRQREQYTLDSKSPSLSYKQADLV